MKWQRQYEREYLDIANPTSLSAKIQRNAKLLAKIVHVDKLKNTLVRLPSRRSIRHHH